jgi:hypothetical protein
MDKINSIEEMQNSNSIYNSLNEPEGYQNLKQRATQPVTINDIALKAYRNAYKNPINRPSSAVKGGKNRFKSSSTKNLQSRPASSFLYK